MTAERKNLWKAVLIVAAALLFWTFIVFFPNPFIFIRNIMRYAHFPIDPTVIELVESEVPEKPVDIERFVLSRVKYQYDWENYGVPDYVSTARQTLTKGRGDCEDRALVLGSLLEAKGIPYELKASIVHYWVDYPGKRASRSENDKVAFFEEVDGKRKLKLPALSQWRQYFKLGRKGLWDVMPLYRKIFMLSGWAVIILMGIFFSRLQRKRLVPIRKPSAD